MGFGETIGDEEGDRSAQLDEALGPIDERVVLSEPRHAKDGIVARERENGESSLELHDRILQRDRSGGKGLGSGVRGSVGESDGAT